MWIQDIIRMDVRVNIWHTLLLLFFVLIGVFVAKISAWENQADINVMMAFVIACSFFGLFANFIRERFRNRKHQTKIGIGQQRFYLFFEIVWFGLGIGTLMFVFYTGV